MSNWTSARCRNDRDQSVRSAAQHRDVHASDVIAPNEITEMPLNGRNFNDLVFTVAGVQPAEQSGKGAPYVINGARADASNVVIDGINDENPRDAGSQAQP